MPGITDVSKLITMKPGNGLPVINNTDIAFSSDFNLDKIVKIIKTDGEVVSQSTAHGLGYAPRVISMNKNASSKFAWDKLGSSDDSNIYATADSGESNYSVVLLDPIVSGSYSKQRGENPLIIVGANSGDSNKKIHSGYDTFKVCHTDRLEIDAPSYDPGSGGGTVTSTATYNHGLGYVPMYAPFVQRSTDLWFYLLSAGSVDAKGEWATSTYYYAGEEVYVGETFYWCLQGHTSGSTTEPGTGVNWASYWSTTNPGVSLTDIYINRLEDYRPSFVVFGDEGDHNDATVKLEITNTQLILTLTRTVNPSSEPFYTYQPYPATHIYVDYTIFHNRIDEEIDFS